MAVEDIFENMDDISIDELGSSLLQRKADQERRAAKKARKNERIQKGLALLLMGQGIMKTQLKQRIKEAEDFHKFNILGAEDKARKVNVNSTIISTIGNKWDGQGGYEGFKNSEDYLGFEQAVRPFIIQKIKASTGDEYDTIENTSTFENAINLATEGYARKYLEIDPVSKKPNYLAYEDSIRKLLKDPERNLDREELLQRAMGLDGEVLNMYKRQNYQNILNEYKSQGNLIGGFRRVLGLFNDDFKNKSGFDIFTKFDESTLAGPTIRDLNQAINLKGMTNNIVSKALADASKSPTRWRQRAEGKRFENYRKDISEIYLPQMTALLDEGRYPSELQTDTFIGKRNFDEFMRDISDEDRRDLVLDTAALSLRLKEDRKFLIAVYNETEGKKADGKSFNEFKAILDDEASRTMFAAMIVTDAGFRDESWNPFNWKDETYNSFGTLTKVYNRYNISTMIGDDIKVNDNGGISLPDSYIQASKNQKQTMLKSTVKEILTTSKTENERNIKLGGALDSEINRYFGMDSQSFIEMLAEEEMKVEETPVTLEEKIQKRIDELPEQTPAGAFLTGDSRERHIKIQENIKLNKEKRQEFNKKKNELVNELRNIKKDKTLPITRNLFTLPSEKEEKEIKDENARYVTNLIREKYGINPDTNLQRLNLSVINELEKNPESYNEILDIIKNKNNREYLESLTDEKKKTELNSNYENPDYLKLLDLHLTRLGIDAKEIATRDLNELSDFILEVESDGDFNAANPNSSARGGYQFIKGSVVPAVNRLEKYLGPLPRFDEVRKTGDVRSLSPEDQTLLFMADILEKKGSDKLINKFLNADNTKDKKNAAYQIYAVLHHTTDKQGKIPKIAELQTKRKLRKYFNE